MESHQNLPHNHSPLGLLKSSSNTHSRGILFTTRSSTFTRYNWHKTRTHKTARILSVLDRFWQRGQEDMMTTRIVSARSFFATMHTNEVQTDWLALSQTVSRTKCYTHGWKRSMTTHIRTRQQRTSGRNDEKMVARHKQTLFSSSWMPL